MTIETAKTLVRRPAKRGVVEPWLFAAFLVFFAAALASPVSGAFERGAPASALASKAGNGRAEAERSDRGVLRAASHVVRAALAKGSDGGKDLLVVRPARANFFGLAEQICGARTAETADCRAHAYGARAPPRLSA